MDLNFCRRCGSSLTKSGIHEGYTCANGHVIFANPAPTVGVFLLTNDGKVLLSIRGIEPNKGMLDSIGGFVEINETFEQAAIRETEEETGLTPDDYGQLTYLTSAPNDYAYGGESRSVLSCFYYATMQNDAKPVANDDVASLKFVRPKDINLDDVGDAKDIRVGMQALIKLLT